MIDIADKLERVVTWLRVKRPLFYTYILTCVGLPVAVDNACVPHKAITSNPNSYLGNAHLPSDSSRDARVEPLTFKGLSSVEFLAAIARLL